MEKRLNRMDILDTYLEDYYKSLLVVSVPHTLIAKMDFKEAVEFGLNNLPPTFLNQKRYSHAYYDEMTHNLILIFQRKDYKENKEKENE